MITEQDREEIEELDEQSNGAASSWMDWTNGELNGHWSRGKFLEQYLGEFSDEEAGIHWYDNYTDHTFDIPAEIEHCIDFAKCARNLVKDGVLWNEKDKDDHWFICN